MGSPQKRMLLWGEEERRSERALALAPGRVLAQSATTRPEGPSAIRRAATPQYAAGVFHAPSGVYHPAEPDITVRVAEHIAGPNGPLFPTG